MDKRALGKGGEQGAGADLHRDSSHEELRSMLCKEQEAQIGH